MVFSQVADHSEGPPEPEDWYLYESKVENKDSHVHHIILFPSAFPGNRQNNVQDCQDKDPEVDLEQARNDSTKGNPKRNQG